MFVRLRPRVEREEVPQAMILLLHTFAQRIFMRKKKEEKKRQLPRFKG
jgi:hypothetical protein